jgi:hypothetical protein
MLEAQIQKRRRRSDQSLSEYSPVASSSANHKPSKKARETSPKPECGTKRFQDADESPGAPYYHPPENKRAKQEILSPATRPKITGSSSRPSHLKPKTGTGLSTGSSSSTHPLPNFILPPEIRTKYAIQVERADKFRKEGNVQYEKKNYPVSPHMSSSVLNFKRDQKFQRVLHILTPSVLVVKSARGVPVHPGNQLLSDCTVPQSISAGRIFNLVS